MKKIYKDPGLGEEPFWDPIKGKFLKYSPPVILEAREASNSIDLVSYRTKVGHLDISLEGLRILLGPSSSSPFGPAWGLSFGNEEISYVYFSRGRTEIVASDLAAYNKTVRYLKYL